MTAAATVELLAMQAAVAAALYDLDQGVRTHSVARASQMLCELLRQSAEALDGKLQLGDPFARLRYAAANMTRYARAEQRSAQA